MITEVKQRLQDLKPSILWRHTNCSLEHATHKVVGRFNERYISIALAANQLDAYRIKRITIALRIYDEVFVQEV